MDTKTIHCLKESLPLYMIEEKFPELHEKASQFAHFVLNKYMLDVIQQLSEAEVPNIGVLDELFMFEFYFNTSYSNVLCPKEFISKFYSESNIPIPDKEEIPLNHLILDYILHNLVTEENRDQILLMSVSKEVLDWGDGEKKCEQSGDPDSKSCQELLDYIKSKFCGNKNLLRIDLDQQGEAYPFMQPIDQGDSKRKVKRTRTDTQSNLQVKKPKT